MTGGKGRTVAAKISVADGREVPGIDLVLPEKRIAATLRVEVRAPGGQPYTGANVTLENLAGIQRWHSNQKSSVDGVMEVPAYVGEQYIVKATAFDIARNQSEEKYDYLGGSSQVDVTTEHPAVVVVMAKKRFSDGQ